MGIGPYEARSAAARHGIKAAPCRVRHGGVFLNGLFKYVVTRGGFLFTLPPLLCHSLRRATRGGHKGRPYAALSAWSVGRGAHTPPNRTPGITGHASEIAGLPGRIYNPPLRTRSRPRRRGGLYARPKPGPDSRRGTMVPPARTAGQSKISPGAERKLSFRTVPGLSAFIGMLAGYFINLSMAEQRSSRACSSPSSTASTIQCRI